MNFCTHSFVLIFLPLFFVVYFYAYKFKGIRASKYALLLFSFCFYLFSSVPAFFILLIECIATYLIADISCKHNSKLVLGMLISLQVGVLIIFKYLNFFIETINTVIPTSVSTLNIIVPLGISFFTFQQIAYSVDVYRGEIEKRNFLDYLCFSFLFITISSGPIIYYNEIIPQLDDEKNHSVNYENMYRGLLLFLIGLCKKVLVANVFSNAVNVGYDNIFSYSTVSAFILSLCYTFQIYFDFSGYCDMGLGIAKMMNLSLPLNFNSPYKSYNIAEFWDRWHITLTRFFTKYIYIPLGGSRKGTVRTYFNIFLIFFISGLWHGADKKFIIWGILHGMAMIAYRFAKKYIDKWHPAFNWIITFSFVNTAWIYFGAPTTALANTIVSKLIKYQEGGIHETLARAFILKEVDFAATLMNFDIMNICPNAMLLIYIVIAFLVILCCRNSVEYVNQSEITLPAAICIALFGFWAICSITGTITFVYQYF